MSAPESGQKPVTGLGVLEEVNLDLIGGKSRGFSGGEQEELQVRAAGQGILRGCEGWGDPLSHPHTPQTT